jgi:prepilin-type processing-associated H-X9-DG protein
MTSFAHIVDGTSRTLMFGEWRGGRMPEAPLDHGHQLAYSWMGGSGHPSLWGLSYPRRQGPGWWQYSSYHPQVVQFCFADGSVRPISVEVGDLPFLYASGMRDGFVINDPHFT